MTATDYVDSEISSHIKDKTTYDVIPNEITRQTMELVDRGEDLHRANDSNDLFRQFGI